MLLCSTFSVLIASGLGAKTLMLRSGGTALAMVPGKGGSGLRLGFDRQTGGGYRQPLPLAVDVVDKSGAAVHLTGGYEAAAKTAGGLVCTGTLQTAHGTRFRITDTFHALPKAAAFVLSRTVAVSSPSPDDQGFNSQFSWEPEFSAALTNDDCFVPAVWYKQNAHVPPRALASSLTDRIYLFREDRLPLPLVSVRDRRTGVTLLLAHLGGHPATFAGEDGLSRIIDARMQFGSLGLLNTGRPAPAFMFPGTEGERTYTYGGSVQNNRWAYRSHPVAAGVLHSYTLLFALSQTPSFPAAVRHGWRTVYAQAAPPVVPVPLGKVYKDSLNLLAAVTHPYNGVISVPFEASIPDGHVYDTSSEMRFVGQALPAAALLLRGSLEGDTAAAAYAEQVVDFWATNSMTPNGMPHGWYDIHADGTFTWRSDPLFLRIASDGMDGTLHAWNILHVRGQDKPDWLRFCRRYGDWLVQAQASDGSWARSYGFDGRVVNPATDTTDQPIPFLVDLYFATGDVKYKQAALRAAEFSWKSVHQGYAYVGRTPNNPNVLDKEGGTEALSAFLALYDLTQDKRWVQAAAQAADYCESWVYC